MNVGIIVAAGKSERMGPKVDKAFLSLGTKPVLAYPLIAFEKCPDIDGIVLVVRKDRIEAAYSVAHMFGCSKLIRVVAGGAKRQTSVSNGMSCLDDDVNIVSIHDGARPCLSAELISDTIKAAKRYGSGVAAAKITDTVKFVEKGYKVTRTVDRTKLWAVQTPQSFKKDLLRKAMESAAKNKQNFDDEASALEAVDGAIQLVPSSPNNLRINCPDDLDLAAAFLMRTSQLV